jgi:aspartyl protease family protein
MKLWRSLGILGFVASVTLAPVCRADDDALKSKTLVKNGSTYVLPSEQELLDGMKNLRKLKTKVDLDNRQRAKGEAQIKMMKNAIAGAEYQHVQLHEQFTKLNDVTQRNKVVDKANLLLEQIRIARDELAKAEKDVNGLGGTERTEFVNTVIELGTKADAAMDTYKSLSDDPDVKQTLEKLNQPGKPKMKLGPTPEFTTNVNALKKWRGDVASDVIHIKNDNQVPVVEVTLNGNVIREMVVDSGASMVCLTADLAKQLNMVPGDKDPEIHFKMADGKVVEARQMVLKSVRVGQFTVADVDCAVLPATLVAAEPLLGGTFLNNFIFKIDASAGEMHLSVISGNTRVTTVGKDTKKTTGSKSTSGK